MKKYLLPDKKHIYKANLHAHATGSDGKLTPLEMKEYFKQQGYDILCITEHEMLFDYNKLYSDNDFLFLNGYELAVNEKHAEEWSKGKCTHLNLYAKSPDIHSQVCFTPEEVWFAGKELTDTVDYIGNLYERTFSAKCINDIISQANNNGYIVCLNHPNWSTTDARDICEYKGLFALELYNTDCAYWGYNSYAENEYDSMLRSNNKIFAQMADDNHNTVEGDLFAGTFGGYNMIFADNLNYESIVSALEAGDFYCSMAPEIKSLYIEDNKIKITCSPVNKIVMSTDYRYIRKAQNVEGEFIYEAEFDIPIEAKYIRFTLEDKNGKKANTRAYFKEELI